MHRFKQIEYKAGITVEVVKCMPRGCRKGEVRVPVQKKTREEMVEANMRQAARKLARKINANFKPGDWHIILTYRPEKRPDLMGAQENIKELLKELRKIYRKGSFELKYIYVTEYKKKSIHHHLIINNVNDGKKTTSDYVRALWGDKGSPKLVSLYDDGEYSRLAEYFIKETEKTFRDKDSPVRQRYACSRNLINPKPKIRSRKTKGMWKLDPKPRPGYYIDQDSLYNGTDKLGYPYQRYVMIKLNPTDADWEPCTGFPSD
jgi:hypothetical protein